MELTVFENGIFYLKAHNRQNKWDFQIDDVVGPLELNNEEF